jgi:hypothetical protein
MLGAKQLSDMIISEILSCAAPFLRDDKSNSSVLLTKRQITPMIKSGKLTEFAP